MATSHRQKIEGPLHITYAPQRRRPLQPVEVVDRTELLSRIDDDHLTVLQRPLFHQLILCTGGRGTHEVDYDTIEFTAGTLLRIFPGQVQRFLEPHFDALMIVWPQKSHQSDPAASDWHPGSEQSTLWHIDDALKTKLLGWIGEISDEQDRFDGSVRRVALMQALLHTLLLRLAIELPEPSPRSEHLPRPYLEYCRLIEDRLRDRPTVTALAKHMGYSPRTLDRACQNAIGKTAKQVMDERIAIEIGHLLTNTSLPVTVVAEAFGFSDSSNFSKYVKRHLGTVPGQLRTD